MRKPGNICCRRHHFASSPSTWPAPSPLPPRPPVQACSSMRQGSCYRFLPFFYISGFWVLDWTPPLPLPPFGDESLPYHHTCYIVTSIFSCLITRQLKLKICEGRFGKGQCGLAWPMMSPSWSSNRELVHLSVATPVKNTRLSPDRRKSEHWHQHRWQTGRYHHQYMATPRDKLHHIHRVSSHHLVIQDTIIGFWPKRTFPIFQSTIVSDQSMRPGWLC